MTTTTMIRALRTVDGLPEEYVNRPWQEREDVYDNLTELLDSVPFEEAEWVNDEDGLRLAVRDDEGRLNHYYARPIGHSRQKDRRARNIHFKGVDEQTIQHAREGTNRFCVNCGREPLAGGLRCWECFVHTSRQRRYGVT